MHLLPNEPLPSQALRKKFPVSGTIRKLLPSRTLRFISFAKPDSAHTVKTSQKAESDPGYFWHAGWVTGSRLALVTMWTGVNRHGANPIAVSLFQRSLGQNFQVRAMSLRIRRANLDTDRLALIELFREQLTPRSDAARFNWLYCDGPFGEALAWVTYDEATAEIVGAAAAFPRRIYFESEVRMGLVLGDFCMKERFRSLGPSLQLQRVCVGAIETTPFEFFYDFPSLSMMAIYKRLGYTRTGSFVRWAKPLRIESKLEPLIRSKRLAKGVGAVANAVLARRGWKGSLASCEIEPHQGLCGEEFTALDTRLRPQSGIKTVRTAQYLNWRYLTNSDSRHDILTARRDGQLIGYVVCTKNPEDAAVVDLCSAANEPGVIARLLGAAVEKYRVSGAATVSLNAGDAHPWQGIFERAGFRRREISPLVACGRLKDASSGNWFQQNWQVMRGERDS